MHSIPSSIPASLIEAFLAALSILMGLGHSFLIKAGKKILHGLWAAIYCVTVAACWHFLGGGWLFWIAQVAFHLPAFNWSLDTFRGLPLDYVSTETTSIIDQTAGRALPFIEALICGLYMWYNLACIW